MTEQALEQVPVLREPVKNIERICGMGRDVELIVTRGDVSHLNVSFQTEIYAFNIHVQGRMESLINHQPHVVEAPGFSSVMPGQSLQITATSEDMVEYAVSCSREFMEELHLNLSNKAHDTRPNGRRDAVFQPAARGASDTSDTSATRNSARPCPVDDPLYPRPV